MSSSQVINGCANELLEAQTLIWNYHLSFIKSMSLKCAIHNHGGRPMTLSDLASALSIHPTKVHHLDHLMRFLVQAGFFAEQDIAAIQTGEKKKGYVLTVASRLLLKDSPFSQRPLVLAVGPTIMTKPWDFTSQWLQNSDDQETNLAFPFALADGKPVWEYAIDKSKFNEQFNAVMASDSLLSTSLVISKCREVFKELTSIVDVGGGTGSMAKAIANEFPNTNCVVSGLEEIPSADAIMLNGVLHDLSDEDCVKILKLCRKGVSISSKLIIIDMVLGDKEKSIDVETQLLYDMQMMVQSAGKGRNEEEWKKLFNEAGFGACTIRHVLGLRSLIEVYPWSYDPYK